MKIEIFKLFGSILVNSDEADKSLAKTDEHAEKVGGTLAKGIGTAAKWGIGLATAAGAGAAALFGMAVKASEAAANIDDVAQRTNLSAKTLQEFKHAAEMSGFSMETIEGAAKKLTKTMGAYKDGNKATVEAFKELGLSAVGANGKLKSTDELFPQIIAKLADMKDITERDALSMAIFGKSAMDMSPMLNGGSEGIKQLTDEAHKMGLVMSDESVAAGAKFDDSLTLVKSSLGAMVTKIGIEVLPMVQQMLEWFSNNMPTIESVATKVFDGISSAIGFVKDNANWLIPVLGGLVTAIVALNVINTVMALMALWKASTIAMTLAQGGLNAVLAANPIGIVIIAIGLLVAAGIFLWQNWGKVSGFLKNIFSGIKETAVNVFNSILDFFREWGPLILAIITGPIGLLVLAIVENWDTIKSTTLSVFGAIGSFVGGVIDGIANGFKGMVNGVIKGLNFMINALNKLKFTVPDWIPAIGGKGFGFNIPTIPSFDVGSRYVPFDTLAMVHEGEQIIKKSENPYANSGGKTLNSGINQTVNIYSPTALSPSETARQNKRALQELALQF